MATQNHCLDNEIYNIVHPIECKIMQAFRKQIFVINFSQKFAFTLIGSKNKFQSFLSFSYK